MLSKILQALGVNMGEQKDINEEDQEFVTFNEKTLDMAGGNWHNPPGHIPSRDASKLIERKNRGLWGWKDPRNCLTLGAFLPSLPENTKYIIIRRDAKAVAESLEKRNGLPQEESKRLWKIYNDKIDSWGVEALELDYEEVRANKQGAIDKIARHIGVEPTERAREIIR
jgi:hypothetical protein